MEILRQKNQATTIVFPLISSGSNSYYTTSAWASLTNKSISAYSWSDGIAASTHSMSQTPTQLDSIGLWSLSATAGDMNPNSGNNDYLAIKLKADQIKEQTVLIILNDYSSQSLADTTNKVVASTIPQVYVSANGDKTGYSGVVTNAVSVSAYTNFPQVTVVTNLDKAGYALSGTKNVLDDLNDIDGTAVTATSIPEVTVGEVTVSAYNNFPNVTVATNLDKAGYALSGTKNVLDDLNDIDGSSVTATSIPEVTVGEVTVSAYNNFPQVTVITNLDKSGYALSGTKNVLDDLNDIDGTAVTATSIPEVTVGQVTVSAYNNFPQVYVSAGEVTNVTGNVSGSVNNVVVPQSVTVGEVTVSAYNNFPQVQVSGMNDNTITSAVISDTSPLTSADFSTNYYDKIESLESQVTLADAVRVSAIDGGLYVGTSAYTNFPQVYVSANGDKAGYALSGTKNVLDDLNDIDGTAVTATSIPAITVGEVTVSAYNNFPQVTVITNLDKAGYALSGTKNVLDDLNDIDGTAVTATSIPAISIGSVQVSGIDVGVITSIQSGLATSTNVSATETALTNLINALNDLSESDIQTIIGLNVSNTVDELASAPINPTLAQAMMLDYMQRRNKQVTDGGTSKSETYNDAGTVILDATISDNGTVFTKEKLS